MSTITSTITLKDYPYWSAESPDEVQEQLRLITNTRKEDITVIAQITSSFIAGRKVGKIPTGSADVDPTDKIGDVNYFEDGGFSYLAILMDISGTPEWRRVELESW